VAAIPLPIASIVPTPSIALFRSPCAIDRFDRQSPCSDPISNALLFRSDANRTIAFDWSSTSSSSSSLFSCLLLV
jgi:hypothetical protein